MQKEEKIKKRQEYNEKNYTSQKICSSKMVHNKFTPRYASCQSFGTILNTFILVHFISPIELLNKL